MIDLKYPVLLVHGISFRDMKHVCYWGRIPSALRKEGVDVYFGEQDSNGMYADNAEFLAERIKMLCAENGIEKFNIIAHSKGGLDIRYMLSHLDMAPYVASLTTIGTPHNGSHAVDMLMKWPQFFFKSYAKFTDWWLHLFGDQKPNAYKVYRSFMTSEAAQFNMDNPDVPGVYYQSYATVCKSCIGDPVFLLTYPYVKRYGGEKNDGLVTPHDVMWGEFRGVYEGKSWRGVSHCDVVDMTRLPLSFGKNEGNKIADIREFYVDMVRDLAEKGF
ncbi:MAG: alpha/beta fold hydrolase [Clostridiales bacterium]|nr:alpha/beta fold hydrolase [Clostridiales bacterium]